MRPAILLRLAVAAGLLALLALSLDAGAALGRLRQAHPLWLAAALAALSIQTLLSAWRWRLVAGAFGIGLGRRQAVAEYYLSQIVNQAVPGGVAGDVGRAWRSAAPGGLMRAGGAVLVERLAGNLMLLAVLAAVSLLLAILPGDQGLPAALPLQVLAAAGFAVLAGLGLAALLGRRRAAGPLRAALARVAAGGILPRLTLLSLGTVLANLAAFALAARATGTALPVGAALMLVPLILGAMLVPVTISGWGLREGAAAALFPLAGLGAEAGLAASIAFGLLFLVASLPGLGVMLWARTRNATAAARVGCGRPDSRALMTEDTR